MRLTDDQIGAELRALRETRERELTWGRLLPALGALAAVAVVAVVISNLGDGGGPQNAASPTSLVAPAPSQKGTGAANAANQSTDNFSSQQARSLPTPTAP